LYSLYADPALPYIPLLPIAGAEELLPTLREYVSTVSGHMEPANNTLGQEHAKARALELLKLCSPDGLESPIPEHEVLVMSDIVGSFQELLKALESKDGNRYLEDVLGPKVVEQMRLFWTEELVLD
jgi:hypothetical protein